jgi:hypothetical protein
VAIARIKRTDLLAAVVFAAGLCTTPVIAQSDAGMRARMDKLEEQVQLAEDLRAVKRLQRIYGYYLDKGMWEDLADLFTDDAIAMYPAGTYIGYESIRRHLFLNVGAVELGENGLGEGRLYNHMNIQPVVHVDPGGKTAKGRWRAFAYFGRYGAGSGVWAEGVYEMQYEKRDGVWRIHRLTYHDGFGAPYATGWVNPGTASRRRGPRNLRHPADEERNMPCGGFPEACIAPFHYENLGTSADAHAWTTGATPDAGRKSRTARATELARRAARLSDEQQIENLQRIYGYYLDRRLWDHVADLFAEEGTIEMDMRGVYVGRRHIREFLEMLGPPGLSRGQLNDHIQLQIVVDVTPDGMHAKSRSREFNMTGQYQSHGQWSEGIYTNEWVKEDGVWKIQSLRFYSTFITDYNKGWTEDAKPAPGVSRYFPPDRPPSDEFEIYPVAHIPPYHYVNPVSGERPRYPRAAGMPSEQAIRAATRPFDVARPAPVTHVGAAVSEAERQVARYRDYHELENLKNAYGYYLDKNLWNDLADLFAEDGSMELAQRGYYAGRERVRAFLFNVFGPEGPVEGRLGNHIQMQPVITIADDGQTARIRSRMMQQLTFGPRASMGASVYEDDAVKEDGVWRFRSVHTFNTWTAGYDGGWAWSPGLRVPGPSTSFPPDGPPTFEFAMFPTVYELPFHYDNPVSGRPSNTKDFVAPVHP